MKIFISWSGDVSKHTAIALRDWLSNVIQAVKPFVSSEDIERGSRWFAEIGKELKAVNFGILCITPQNMNAPWILFEAGALSKSLGQSRVTPLLIGLRNADLEGPLSQFNTTSIEKSEILKLVKTINNHLEDKALPEPKLEEAFERWWPDLETPLSELTKRASDDPETLEKPLRDQGEMLEEILELTRSIARQTSKKQEIDKMQQAEYWRKFLSAPSVSEKKWLYELLQKNVARTKREAKGYVVDADFKEVDDPDFQEVVDADADE